MTVLDLQPDYFFFLFIEEMVIVTCGASEPKFLGEQSMNLSGQLAEQRF